MKARLLIEGATFTPDVLKVVQAAFEQAWVETGPRFGSDPQVVEAERLRLALAVLSVADEDSKDVEALKAGALQALARDYSVAKKPRLSET
jgi:hypothetical protein